MNYPLISEYIEAIKAAEDNFAEVNNLRPVLGEDGLPVMTSGNFAVVFKMKDVQTGKFYAVKCFTKNQERRAESYRLITEELKNVSSAYLVDIRYMEKELFVDTSQTDETEFPVLVMDWVEGMTLDRYLRENLDDKYALEMLAYRFSQLAQWLIPQPFAHGDLKPDNILVREDGSLVLVDYDGMYVPAMKGQKARELGSPDYRHPLRTEDDFDERIDDFACVSIFISLKAISLYPPLLEEYGAIDRLLLSEKDYKTIHSCKVLARHFRSYDIELRDVVYAFFNWDKNNPIKTSLFKIPHPKLIYFTPTSVSFIDWEEKVCHDDGYSWYSKDGRKIIKFYDTITVGSSLGSDEIETSECSISEGTITICDKCFADTQYLRYLNIPSSVKYIGKEAFANSNIRFIELPSSIEYISEDAFTGCQYLTTILVCPKSGSKIKELLPNNLQQLYVVNKIVVISQIKSFLDSEQNNNSSYWETLKSIMLNLKRILSIFREVDYSFRTYDDSGVISISDPYSNNFSNHHISNIHDKNEIANAIYYLLLDISGVSIIDRIACTKIK